MIDLTITPRLDTPITPINPIKAYLKGRVLGIESDPYKGNLILYLDHEAMNNVLDENWDELEGLHFEVGFNYLEFFPKDGEYEVKITF